MENKESKQSFSFEGEDILLSCIFKQKPRGYKGFYIDVGAYHPMRFSNTYYFYKKGWRGINIDAMPGSMKLFNKLRPEDINLEVGISNKTEKLNYFMFNEPALNGFSEALNQKRFSNDDSYQNSKNVYKVIAEKEIQTYPLAEILDKYLPLNKNIDFMSIDVEGLDYEVLTSNNWEKYKPEFILIEILRSNIPKILNSDIHKYLTEKNYVFFAKTQNTVFFRYDS